MPHKLSEPPANLLPPAARFAAVALVLWEELQHDGSRFSAEVGRLRTDLESLGYTAHPYPARRSRLRDVGWDIPAGGLHEYLDSMTRPLIAEWHRRNPVVDDLGRPRARPAFGKEEAHAVDDAAWRAALSGPYAPYVAFNHLTASERPRLDTLIGQWFPSSTVQEPSAFGALSAGHLFLVFMVVFECTWRTVPLAIRTAATEGMLVPLYWPTTLPAARMWEAIHQRLRQAFQEPGQTVEGLEQLYGELDREWRLRWSLEDPNDGYARYLKIGGDLPELDAVKFVRQHYAGLRRLKKAIPKGKRSSAWWRSLEGVLREWAPYARHAWGKQAIPSGDEAYANIKVVKNVLQAIRSALPQDPA